MMRLSRSSSSSKVGFSVGEIGGQGNDIHTLMFFNFFFFFFIVLTCTRTRILLSSYES